jgi:hypothetical protein
MLIFLFFHCFEGSKFRAMKKCIRYSLILLVLITQNSFGIEYDFYLLAEFPRIKHGKVMNRSIVLRPGITYYPKAGSTYFSAETGMGKGGAEFNVYGGKYEHIASLFLHPEIGLGWCEQSDSLTSSVKITASYPFRVPVKIVTDWDPLAGRVYSRGEVQKYADWKMPWIFSASAGINVSHYSQGKYDRYAGLSDLGLGISTWTEIGPYYGEFSLHGGPVFLKFHPDSYYISVQFLFIRSKK